MAVSITNLLGPVGSGADATSYAIASATYTSGRYYLVSISHTKATTPDEATSVSTTSGPTITFSKVATIAYSTIASPTSRVSIWGGQCTGTGTSAGTIDFGANTQTGLSYALNEVTGHDTVSTIVQSATNRADSPGTTLTVSLSPFANASNASFGAFSRPTNAQITNGLTTELSDNGNGTPPNRLETQWQVGDVDPSCSISVNDALGGAGCEIAILPVTVTAHLLTLLGVGA